MEPISAIAAGVGIASGLKGLFSSGGGGGGGGKSFKGYRPYRGRGELTREDYEAAERTRGRLTTQSNEFGRGLRTEALRRYQRRGLAGAPAQEATLSRIADIEATGRQHAGDAAEELLYNVRLGREMQDVQGYYAHESRQAVAHAAYLNSLLEFTPRILSFFDSLDRGGDFGGFDTFGNPNEGEPERNYG